MIIEEFKGVGVSIAKCFFFKEGMKIKTGVLDGEELQPQFLPLLREGKL